MHPKLLASLATTSLLLAAAACTDSGTRPLPSEPRPLAIQSGTCTLGVSDAEALALIDELLVGIAQLETSQTLTAGQANALRTHLSNVRKNILQGNYCTARVQLEAFRTQIRNFVTDNVLTPEQAETLLGGATDVVDGYPHFVSISAGAAHTCGLTEGNVAWCWGTNFSGQLGDGTGTDRRNPVQVGPGLDLRFTSISAGATHSCGLTAAGEGWCWGTDQFGELGNGEPKIGAVLPTPVAPGSEIRFSSLSAGNHLTCGVSTTGVGYCWGRNGSGQVGDGTTDDRSLPVVVGPGMGLVFTSIDPSEFATSPFACGRTTDNRGWCWGNSTVFGMLGDGGFANSSVPVEVGPGMNLALSRIDVGSSHACALTTSGAAHCWGANGAGQLGNGTADFPVGQPLDNTKTHRLPEPVVGGHVFSSIESGGNHVFLDIDLFYRSYTCGITTSGQLLCWGLNRFGQLGDGTTTDRPSPTVVTSVTGGFTQVSAGAAHTCALSGFGRAYCWGANFAGELGDGTTTAHLVPKPVRFVE